MSSHKRISIPIEQKESYRWVKTLEEVKRFAAERPGTQFLCVADSEADIYELLVAGMAQPRHADWILRACHDRVLAAAVEKAEGQGSETCDPAAEPRTLRQRVLQAPLLFRKTIEIRERQQKYNCEHRGRRQPRQARTAEVEVRAMSVTLRAPWRPENALPDLTVNVVLVHEPAPPDGEPAVEWMLLTSLPIDTHEQVEQVIQYYAVRWLVEIFSER